MSCQWATSTTIDIAGVSDRLTGVIGASGIFLAALALYLVLSIVVLLG